MPEKQTKRTVFSNPVLISLLFIAIVSTWVSSNYKWGDGFWKGILKSDATGYYAYLPALFIYNDLNFNYYDSLRKETGNHDLAYEFRRKHNGSAFNKYYVGTAVLQTPFFLLGQLTSILMQRDLDGYSAYYMIFIQIGTIIYLLTGLLFLSGLLRSYQSGKRDIALVLLVIVFGTNVFHYTVSEPGMSHIYSFALITAFLFFMRSFFGSWDYRKIYLSAALLGLILITRPVNLLIVLLIPFLAETPLNLLKGLKLIFRQPAKLMLSILIFLTVISIQFIIYKIQTGSFFLYSYPGEGFQFGDPDMINILFSYRKGLFVYCPALFVSLFGLYFLFKRKRFAFWSWLGFFAVLTYVLSSWYQWFYGGSFSSRVYIEYYAIFGIPMALLLKHITHKVKRGLFIAFLFLLMIFTQIQTYQYRTGIIHWSEMNREKYWEVFPSPQYLEKEFNRRTRGNDQ